MDARFRDIGFVFAGGSLTFLDFETFPPKLWEPVKCHCGEIIHRHDRVKHCRYLEVLKEESLKLLVIFAEIANKR